VFALATKLSEDKTCSANERFDQDKFTDYYHTRLKAEEWLLNNFTKLGGTPKEKHPLYFYVHGWDLTAQFWPENITEKILLADIDPCDISFTFGDSCGAVDNPDKHYFLLKDELLEMISTHDSIENLIKHVAEKIGYGMIEAHLWNDKYINKGEQQ